MIVLDTNVVSEADKPAPDRNVIGWLEGQDWSSLFLCGPVVMEQSYGAQRFFTRTSSDRYPKILDRLVSDRFRNRILVFDNSAAILAGALRARRDRIGRPISTSDAMIAAICLIHGATLATRNTRDFEDLDLKLVNPFETGT
jgi:predicted nucleic acid-binding protein